MSKVVLICTRDPEESKVFAGQITDLNQALSPDNITPLPPLMICNPGVLTAVLNPMHGLAIHGNSVCLGRLFQQAESWWRPLAPLVDGSFALFRCDEGAVELVSDSVGSRTIWYFHSDRLFIAASSQRAILSLLGTFEPNEQAFAWMLSSGTLGPEHAWDRRIQRLPGDGQLYLDRTTWLLRVRRSAARFSPQERTPDEHKAALLAAIEATFDDLRRGGEAYTLPLSGGYDSRMILLLLKDHARLKCLTWGVDAAAQDPLNDAYIAKQLANYYHVAHEYYPTNLSQEPVDVLFQRFLVAGEGRVDHIAAYMDGFHIWKSLFERGVSEVVRGDECFGWVVAHSPFGVRRGVGLLQLNDYLNLANRTIFHAQIDQTLPEYLCRQPHETLPMWRDRLYQEFRAPTILAGLNDLKCAYVEIINPLTARRIIQQVRLMPDSLRTEKRGFKEIVSSLGPAIPYATRPAIESSKAILREPRVVQLICDQLSSSAAKQIFTRAFLDYLISGARKYDSKAAGTTVTGSRMLDKAISRLLKLSGKMLIDPYVLAFRAFVVVQICAILAEDARRGAEIRSALSLARAV